MKKLLFIAVFTICGLGTVNAQGFSGGINIGLPVGDTSNFSSFSFGVDVNYMFNGDEEFTYGVATGYQNYSGKNGAPSQDFIPLAVVGRYAVSEQIALGADVGYAISTNGGFYYRPMLVYNLSETMKLNASFSSALGSNGASNISNLGVGLMFDF